MEKRVFAHRGVSSVAPENTLSAIKKCKEYGVSWFECDVDILGDGQIVVFHDDSLERTTNSRGYLKDITRKDLDNISAGEWFSQEYRDEKIPTLKELINIINSEKLNANIEIKSCIGGEKLTRKLVEGLASELKNIESDRKIIVSSFNYLILYLFKKLAPNIEVACLFDRYTLKKDYHSIMEFCGAKYVHPQNEGLTKEIIEEIKSRGYGINVWTVNSLARANELFNYGVDGIFTDFPQNFLSKYKKG